MGCSDGLPVTWECCLQRFPTALAYFRDFSLWGQQSNSAGVPRMQQRLPALAWLSAAALQIPVLECSEQLFITMSDGLWVTELSCLVPSPTLLP